MFGLILKRLASAIPTLFALSILVFLLVKAVPGDPALIMLGDRASPEALEDLRREMGLDQPLMVQYGIFIKKLVVEGDLGRSIRSNEPIIDILSEKFPATMELAIAAIIIAIIVGVPAGLCAAIWHGSLIDLGSMSLAVVGVSMPIFWLALVLVWFFGLELGWFPISGRLAIEYSYEPITGLVLLDSALRGEWDLFWNGVSHITLPAFALATIPMAFFARITRAAMMEVLKQDYVRTARAKGLTPFKIYFKHAFKNASVPVITVIGLQFGLLLGGAIITETVFTWPGIGSWLLEAVSSRDFPAIVGGVLTVATAFVVVNLFVDLIYRFIDPRMRMS
jgi:ABC-type dipeptide/oligopeptide/nickel transport system permease component